MKQPSTSLEAFRNLKPSLIKERYRRIMEALEKIGRGNYETIAASAGLDKIEVNRRLSEMRKLNLVHQPGTKSPTKSGSNAMDYMLCMDATPKVFDEQPEQPKTADAIALELF